MTKQELLNKVNRYITKVSNLDPPPVDYISRLQEFKTLVDIATPAELEKLNKQWNIITANLNDDGQHLHS